MPGGSVRGVICPGVMSYARLSYLQYLFKCAQSSVLLCLRFYVCALLSVLFCCALFWRVTITIVFQEIQVAWNSLIIHAQSKQIQQTCKASFSSRSTPQFKQVGNQCFAGLSKPVLKNLKNLIGWNFRLFRFFNFSSKFFLLFQVKICTSIWIYWSCYFVTFIIAVYGIIFV